jgi:pimeloyl-ACP methyl ester carboxylesterase
MTAFEPWPGLAPYAKTGTGGLFYYDVPPGKNRKDAPVLVLIHGLGDEADSWRRIIPPLCAAGCRVLAPDLPGFGRSPAPGGSSLRRHALAVLGLIGESPASGPRTESGGRAVLIGSSMGAAVAELAAILEPGTVQSLILLDGCMPLGAPVSGPLLLMAAPFIGKKWYRAFRNNARAAWESLYPYYVDPESLPEEDKAFLKRRVMDRVSSPSQERAYFQSLRSMIAAGFFKTAYFKKGMRNWPGSMHLIWGEEDRVMSQSQAEHFLALRNGARLTVIPRAGHLPHQDKPQETAAAILDFLNSSKT